MRKILLSWSSGKDSAWCLHVLRKGPEFEVVGLLTTFNSAFDRVAMHAVRREIVEAQAAAAGIRLWPVGLPWPCSNAQYEAAMSAAIQRAKGEGVEAIAFGDLFLEDIREYRTRQLTGTGIAPLFPVWQIPTDRLAREMIAAGMQARLSCVDPRALPANFAGREFDAALLRDLPPGADPCGERGEFHTCVYAGPMFDRPIELANGEVCERDGFVFADLKLAGRAPA